MIDVLVVYYGCQFYSYVCNYLVLIESCNLGKVLFIGKNQLIYTLLYCTIYRCIVIQKRQYIDTPKSCIVTPPMFTESHGIQRGTE